MRQYFFLLTGVALFTIYSSSFSQDPDLVLINGKIWTGNNQSTFVEALAVKGNTILKTGTTAEINILVVKSTKVIDLKGRLASPGFNDAHIHFLSGSIGLSEVDFTGTKSIEEMIQRVVGYANDNPEKKWITGRGWQYTQFPGGLPTKKALDDVVGDRPIFIKAYDGHSAWVNSKALELAEIDRNTTFSGFGEIVRDQNGEPTGALLESAQSLVANLIPPPDRNEKLNALRKGMKLAASLGITSIQNASGSVEEFSLYEELLDNKELTLRIGTAFSVGTYTTPEDIEKFTQLKNRVAKNDMIRAQAVKFMLDGVIESHTAAMLQPYSDVSSDELLPKGELGLPLERYYELVTTFDKIGFQIYTHAIGDFAVRVALNAYERAKSINDSKDSRYRIEHIEMISPADLPRFSKIGVLPSMEPIHAEPGTIAVWQKAVGENRLPNAFAWSSMLHHNATLVFSSDWPACVSLNPIRGLHTAVTRRTVDGLPTSGWVQEQKISIADALLAYTQRGAYASFEENVKGVIAPGYLADIIVFSQDLFTIDPMKTYETRVVLTVFNGDVIYQEKSFMDN